MQTSNILLKNEECKKKKSERKCEQNKSMFQENICRKLIWKQNRYGSKVGISKEAIGNCKIWV